MLVLDRGNPYLSHPLYAKWKRSVARTMARPRVACPTSRPRYVRAQRRIGIIFKKVRWDLGSVVFHIMHRQVRYSELPLVFELEHDIVAEFFSFFVSYTNALQKVYEI